MCMMSVLPSTLKMLFLQYLYLGAFKSGVVTVNIHISLTRGSKLLLGVCVETEHVAYDGQTTCPVSCLMTAGIDFTNPEQEQTVVNRRWMDIMSLPLRWDNYACQNSCYEISMWCEDLRKWMEPSHRLCCIAEKHPSIHLQPLIQSRVVGRRSSGSDTLLVVLNLVLISWVPQSSTLVLTHKGHSTNTRMKKNIQWKCQRQFISRHSPSRMNHHLKNAFPKNTLFNWQCKIRQRAQIIFYTFMQRWTVIHSLYTVIKLLINLSIHPHTKTTSLAGGQGMNICARIILLIMRLLIIIAVLERAWLYLHRLWPQSKQRLHFGTAEAKNTILTKGHTFTVTAKE